MPTARRQHSARVLLLLLFATWGISIFAQSPPPAMNYQGVLQDAEGDPIEGLKTLQFRVYDAATEGNLIWGPQTLAAPVIGGRFNVILTNEDVAAGGDPVTAPFTGTGNSGRFFSVSVDGSEQSARQQVVSVPFAISAARADNIVVTTDAILDLAVTQPKIGVGAVGFSNIEASAVQETSMATGVVSTRVLADRNVTIEKLAPVTSQTFTMAQSDCPSCEYLTLVRGVATGTIPGFHQNIGLVGKGRLLQVVITPPITDPRVSASEEVLFPFRGNSDYFSVMLEVNGVIVDSTTFFRPSYLGNNETFPITAQSMTFTHQLNDSINMATVRILVYTHGSPGSQVLVARETKMKVYEL